MDMDILYHISNSDLSELKEGIVLTSVTSDGVKTRAQLYAELRAAIDSFRATYGYNACSRLCIMKGYLFIRFSTYRDTTDVYDFCVGDPVDTYARQGLIRVGASASSSAEYQHIIGNNGSTPYVTTTDYSNSVWGSGATTIKLIVI